MTYNLKFLPSALKEWENLNNNIKPLEPLAKFTKKANNYFIRIPMWYHND